jgi:DNA-directed RNA polymerase subunit K/omega
MSDVESFYSDEDDKSMIGGSSDESEDEIDKIDNNVINTDILTEDLSSFMMNYETLKKKYKSQPVLNKFEKTKIISERSQQLANGSFSFLKNPESYSSIYEIAIEELRQKKIPFILKRPIANTFEYWKLEDLEII